MEREREEKRTQTWRKSKRSEQTFQRFRADTGKRAVGLERAYIVWIFEWAEYKGKEKKEKREKKEGNEKTYQRALVYAWLGWWMGRDAEKKIVSAVTLTKDRSSIGDDRSFCAYASFSGVGNYATAGSGGRCG